MTLFLFNFLLAIAWMAFNADFSLTGFVAGFTLGHLVLWLARPLYPGQRYFHVLWGSFGYILWLVKEIWVSSWKVARSVLGFGPAVRPAVVAVPLDVRTDMEITLLASSVTLTPGTLSLDVSPDRRTLYVHTMFGEDAATVRDDIKLAMERRILELLR